MTTVEFERVGIYEANVDGSGDTFQFDINVENARIPLLKEKFVFSKQYKYLDDPLDVTARKNEKFEDKGAGERMETILEYIKKMNPSETNLKKKINSDIVCNRGLLVEIALGKADFRAVRRKGVIFLCSMYAGQKNYLKKIRLNLISGTKFARHMTVAENKDKILSTGHFTKVVNRVTFSKTNVSPITVFSSAEVDAIDNCDLANGNLIEIKCWECHEASKYTRAMLQSYFGGIPIIMIGKKKKFDKKYFVNLIDVHHVDDLKYQHGIDFEEYIDRVYNMFSELNKRLDSDDKAVRVIMKLSERTRFEVINADDCDFVSHDFLNTFDEKAPNIRSDEVSRSILVHNVPELYSGSIHHDKHYDNICVLNILLFLDKLHAWQPVDIFRIGALDIRRPRPVIIVFNCDRSRNIALSNSSSLLRFRTLPWLSPPYIQSISSNEFNILCQHRYLSNSFSLLRFRTLPWLSPPYIQSISSNEFNILCQHRY